MYIVLLIPIFSKFKTLTEHENSHDDAPNRHDNRNERCYAKADNKQHVGNLLNHTCYTTDEHRKNRKQCAYDDDALTDDCTFCMKAHEIILLCKIDDNRYNEWTK